MDWQHLYSSGFSVFFLSSKTNKGNKSAVMDTRRKGQGNQISIRHFSLSGTTMMKAVAFPTSRMLLDPSVHEGLSSASNLLAVSTPSRFTAAQDPDPQHILLGTFTEP